MRNASVIFDVNAYIEFCENYNLNINLVLHEIENFRTKERMLNIDSFAAPSVLLELFAHLADPDDPFYERCKCSLLTLCRHTTIENSLDIKIIPDSESLLARLLFNYEYRELIQKWKEIANLLAQIYNRPDENNLARMRNDIRKISQYVRDEENQFVSDMFNFVVKGLNSSATDWTPLVNDEVTKTRFLRFINSEEAIMDLAKMYVIKACSIAGIGHSNVDMDTLAEKVKSTFSAPLKLYIMILKRIAETGCDITQRSRRNWIWDIQLLFYVTPTTLINKEIFLVSSDRDIIKAAEMGGRRNNVIRLNNYLNLINLKRFSAI